MFSLFRSRRQGNAEVVAGEHDFFRKYERALPDRSLFDAQGETHGELDLQLVYKIEELLVPILGAWEQTDRWFHQMDFYGDGVRSLTFRRDIFPRDAVPAMQALLAGKHSDFTILCCVTDSLLSREGSQPSREDDYIAIWAQEVLVTQRLANEISSDA
ncbi:hypothetical protein [Rubrivivax albus]|uniref:Uncharacterized protein n=1 Tax=Rubrivivax albus TaxID=2499835 RepID=A0A3S2VRZ7_9BURK|nr:hypothetical protein [Rubrivivax albus]RVT47005.1 hypothetical protein ENE75_24475 [Rubrivivax albus]